ncbi:hypothetical protein Tco_0654320 [Tanacetum coccineum]|uniref:Xylulose kinase-1 n=1 Tax=Tanacetum coccineum TaxID=301880 RepID=A0ABQ4X3V0_9ASTR
MTTLKFADTHNMVAFLSKPAKSDGFEQIVDFLNAQPIRYALTVNPTIYISCIEQFWSTGVVKTINGKVQLHARVDGKKIIISKASVRRDLKLEDEEGMIRNLDNVSGKFLMYPRFVQVFLNQQLDRLPTHKIIYNAPSDTKRFFGNMRRVGKGFSGRVTPLFPTMVVQHQSQMGEGSANPTDPHHTPTIIQPSTQPQKTQKPMKPKRKDTQVPLPSDPSDNVADEAVHKELGNSLVRAATNASSLEAKQDSGNITKTRSKETPNKSSSLGTNSGGGPRCQETMGDTIAQTRLKLNELIEMCTTLQKKVLYLEKTKTTQANEIASLKMRVKKLEKKRSSRTHKLKRLYKVGLSARVESSGDEESLVAAKDVNLTVDEVTLAQALAALKSVKPKVKRDVIKEPNVPINAASASTKVSAATTTTAIISTLRKGIVIIELGTPTITRSSQQPSHAEVQDKGKGKMIEPESVKKINERLSRKKDEANVALTKEWDDILANIENKEKKHFAAKSAVEKRNKPPTQAQQRKIMCTYLKNMEGKKLKDLKNKSFDFIQKMFDRAFNRQKVDEDKDTAEFQILMEVIPDEENVAINVVPLATKPPTIREDLVELYKLVKDKYGSTRPVEDMDLLLWGDLKTMFEPHVEDEIWKLQQRNKVLSWKLFDSCGVHCLSLQSGIIYMLVEKRYPLTPPTITDMLNKKL